MDCAAQTSSFRAHSNGTFSVSGDFVCFKGFVIISQTGCLPQSSIPGHPAGQHSLFLCGVASTTATLLCIQSFPGASNSSQSWSSHSSH